MFFVASDEGELIPIDLPHATTVQHLKSILADTFGIPVPQQELIFSGKALDNNKQLQEYEIQENDVIQLVNRPAAPQAASQQPSSTPSRQSGALPISADFFSNAINSIQNSNNGAAAARQPQSQSQPQPQRGLVTSEMFQQAFQTVSQQRQLELEGFREQIVSDAYQMETLKQRNPELANALLNKNWDLISKALDEAKARMLEQQRRRQAEIRALEERLARNPLDVEAQRMLEEEIRMQGVEENRNQAMEHNPESFGSVVMLYIDCKVNNTPVKAFVDSGAQITLMSRETAERCGIMRFVDRSFAQNLVGVGQCRAIGRVHIANIMIGNTVYSSSFTIVEDANMEFLLGLDMLRKHRCVIDLVNNTLRIGDGEEEVPFLAEKDIPKRNLGFENIPSPSGGGAPADQASTQYPEEVVSGLMKMGDFSREQVLAALNNCAGNADEAASLLLASFL